MNKVMIGKWHTMPVLEESSILRYAVFSLLYFAQGIPEGLIIYALPAWFAIHGASPAEIGGFVAIALLPWSLKLINAPVMDRFSYLPMGRRKPWILFGQTGLFLSLISMSFIKDPAHNILLLSFFAFFVNLFSAFQDVATDGLAVEILPVDQQARANGIMWGSKTVGISLSVALGSGAINLLGFNNTVLIFSAVIFLIMLLPLLLRERRGEKLLPWSQGRASETALKLQLHSWKSIFKNLWRVFTLPVSLIMGFAAFSMSTGKGLIDVVLPVMTVQQLGWANTDYSSMLGSAKLISGLAGILAGGILIDYFGKVRMMKVIIALLGLSIIALSLFSFLWHNKTILMAFFFTFYILEVFLTIGIFATAMHLCWKRISATQFTLYMMISNLGLSAGAALLGPLRRIFPYEIIILVFVFFAVLAFIALQYVKFERHEKQISIFEQIHTENSGSTAFAENS